MEALLHRERYRKLHDLLVSGRVEIRVVPKDRVDIHRKAGVIGGLPGTIEDDGTESEEKHEKRMDECIHHLRQKARDVFELRCQETIDPDRDRWELCSRVLARRDVVDRLSVPW